MKTLYKQNNKIAGRDFGDRVFEVLESNPWGIENVKQLYTLLEKI